MFKKIGFSLFFVVGFMLIFSGCSKKEESSFLSEGEVYIGKKATNEIIEVQSNNTWKIKDMNEDDSTYTIATVKELEQKIDDYNLIEVTATELYGEIGSFAKREGRKYILVEDESGDIYFRSISEENIDRVTEELQQRSTQEEKDNYIIKIAKYEFSKK